MSLKAFHLLFITLSIALALFVAAWAAGQYRAGQAVGYLAAAGGAMAGGAALAAYLAVFRRKTKQL